MHIFIRQYWQYLSFYLTISFIRGLECVTKHQYVKIRSIISTKVHNFYHIYHIDNFIKFTVADVIQNEYNYTSSISPRQELSNGGSLNDL